MLSEAVLSGAVLSGAVLVIDRLFGCSTEREVRRFDYEHEHRPQAA